MTDVEERGKKIKRNFFVIQQKNFHSVMTKTNTLPAQCQLLIIGSRSLSNVIYMPLMYPIDLKAPIFRLYLETISIESLTSVVKYVGLFV